jgi:hypothetical protein
MPIQLELKPLSYLHINGELKAIKEFYVIQGEVHICAVEKVLKTIIIYEYMHIYNEGNAIAKWLRHYATSRKVAGSIRDENDFLLIYPILPAALGHGVYSASNRNEYQKQKNVSGQ